MNVHLENTVSTVPNIVFIAHRPEYYCIMKRLQAFKYELMPDGEQQRNRRRFAGSAALYSTRRWRCNKPIMQKATGLKKLLRETRRLPALQEEGPVGYSCQNWVGCATATAG